MPTIPSGLHRLNPGLPCIGTGQSRQIIDAVGATRTLAPEESGALCCFDAATGIVFTLPSASPGMQFDFVFTVSRTSTNAYKIICASGDFLLGAYMAGDATIATSGDVFTGDGSTHVAINLDADTEGGLIGGRLSLTAISASQWYVEGLVIGTGTMATGFATS